ncbi:MAG: hypothetical protein KKD99_13085 [Proteobacteria bacterium]|nr:hypothetical protein [Pseudomonadota bacterium]MBU4353878.1 hypothetical protein [Pseudomonadota bacterium]MBU4449513.1 hypothetical protein [Pseudomonadota bacterium]MCG2772674.1 hypothetical protein [Desulfobacterales bacterium]
MQKMQHSKRKFPAWPRRLLLGLMVAGICFPTLIWGQADQRIPLELKVKLADGKINIGQTFVESLKNRINRSDTFRLSSSDIPRLVLRISSENLPGDPYMAVIAVTRTVAVPWKGGSREIFVDNLVMVGVSAAHSGRDAADILEDTQRNILPRFSAISGEKN